MKRIVDGDTFVVENGSKKGLKIRLIGVDAPETRATGRRRIGYCGAEAKAYLFNLINGHTVELTYDTVKKDRYGRTLAYVYKDGLFVNADLVKRGYACALTVPPNVKYAKLFVELERQARKNKRGLWRK
ncbi:thermonuclease family protein [Sphingobacterium suaedae]|uniref:Thermonuclease family protein n=1 Tax=Sphingobacterium suaedae TaxID=1686402 RepID=A0ABW5KFM6_9SPHI